MLKCVYPNTARSTRDDVLAATPHWDLLFNAVKDRLHAAAEASLAAAAAVPPTATELRLLGAVQACVEALEQLAMPSATLNPPQHRDHDRCCDTARRQQQ